VSIGPYPRIPYKPLPERPPEFRKALHEVAMAEVRRIRGLGLNEPRFVIMRADGTVRREFRDDSVASIVELAHELQDSDDPDYRKRLERARRLLAKDKPTCA
jgi:hypothetical protein